MSQLSAADAALLRRSTRRLAIQTAAIVGGVVVVLLVLLVVVALRQQRQVTDTLLRRAVATADDVGDAPAGTWLAIATAGGWRSSPGIPEGFPRLTAPAASTSGTFADLEVGETTYRTFTGTHEGHLVEAVTDISRQREEQAHVLGWLLGLAALGLVVSAALGHLFARRAVAPLASALTLQRQFVADASHELRAPLTVLSTRVQLLARTLRTAQVPDRLRDEAVAVSRDTARLADTIDDLLLAAEPRDPDSWEVLDLRRLAEEVVAAVRDHAALGDVTVRLAPSDPLAAASLRVVGAATALRRALLALVDNAVAHTPAGGNVTLTLSCVAGGITDGGPRRRRPAEASSVVRVEVSDTGTGIEGEDVDAVFRRFHSGTQRAGRRSYGLGLALAQAVAHRHDGALEVVRTGPDGTTFRLSLPAA